MLIKLFYSWQTDTPSRTCRFFIKAAAKEAIKQLNKQIKIEVFKRDELVLDHDTLDEPGTPPIYNTIEKKIDECSIFLADLTFVALVPGKHGVSNPNVLDERGHAKKSIGYQKIIAVMNESHGKVELLPFNLKGSRWPIRYTLDINDSKETRKIQFNSLVEQLKNAINLILKSGLLVNEHDLSNFKKNLNNPEKAIQISEIIEKHVDKICEGLSSDKFDMSTYPTNEETAIRIDEYLIVLDPFMEFFITCCRWGNTEIIKYLIEATNRIGKAVKNPKHGFQSHWQALRLLPSLLLLYIGGIVALKWKRYDVLYGLFSAYILVLLFQKEESIINVSPGHLPYFPGETSWTPFTFQKTPFQKMVEGPLKLLIKDAGELEYFYKSFELIHNLLLVHERTKLNHTRHHVFCSLVFPSSRTNDAQ